jgi:hypothetical protein
MSLQLLTILSPTTPCIPTLLLTALARDRSRNGRSPFTGRFPFLASPLRRRLANASGRIEFIIVFFMDWSFASGCSPPRLSTSQLLSATDRPVLLSDWDFHPIVGAHFQAHVSPAFRRRQEDLGRMATELMALVQDGKITPTVAVQSSTTSTSAAKFADRNIPSLVTQPS